MDGDILTMDGDIIRAGVTQDGDIQDGATQVTDTTIITLIAMEEEALPLIMDLEDIHPEIHMQEEAHMQEEIMLAEVMPETTSHQEITQEEAVIIARMAEVTQILEEALL